ncbi:basic-leucine zipper transcription factor [Trichoderma citrinoviride]|uniref:Basic-leucine zipper transcription factor n=1 Tax=Trichoderma citrinoviride TaxID=58853 RepID=A0A2T4BAI0_9HYPO|nr:basic-leucine zipper transcription factor [Trichoderma citrinoviride]PTB66327.1 basic-leucine zipper transcription factor [Trichoderma citrinoviride]
MSIDNKPPTQNPGPNPHHRDESEDSTGSTPEREQAPPMTAGSGSNIINVSQDGQQPKRKGGRKPIYATSEERKQRNRQAQAAFRERRTEYIKQLEETIRVHESNLHNLQAAHRTAAEECLMLRYKNSLLERILLEKGIDVQAELQAKTGSPNLAPTHMPQNLVQPPPLQRTMMHRHHARKSTSSIAPKTEPGTGLPPPLQTHKTAPSPKNRPAPSSHSNSPSMASSAFSPAASDTMSMRGSISGMPRQQMTPISVATPSSRQPMMQPGSRGAMNSGASFYPTPSFQNHIEQLGKMDRPRWRRVDAQEYEADMVEDSEIETPSGPGPYPGGFNGEQQPMLLSPASTGPGHQVTTGSQYPSMTQLLDQQPDWDPFGLSASMAFPNQPFQFDQTHMR